MSLNVEFEAKSTDCLGLAILEAQLLASLGHQYSRQSNTDLSNLALWAVSCRNTQPAGRANSLKKKFASLPLPKKKIYIVKQGPDSYQTNMHYVSKTRGVSMTDKFNAPRLILVCSVIQALYTCHK